MTSRFHIVKQPIFFGYILMCFMACAKHPNVDKASLIDYINNEKNGLTQEIASGSNIYRITYRPTDLILEQELRSNSLCNKDSLMSNYTDCLYFVLSLKHDSVGLFGRLYNNYPELLRTVSFGMHEYVTLIKQESGDIFYLSDFVYSRTYDTTPSTSVLLCFKDPQLIDLGDFTIQVKDFLNEDGQQKTLMFHFSKINISNTPTLKL